MYVCICRGVTEKQINQLVESDRCGAGGCSIDQVSSETGLGNDCGCCLEYASELLDKQKCE